MKQIILITDGCSNVGINPVIAASQAREEEIIVNVIGVVEQGEFGEHGVDEIAEIAKAGGGHSQIVSSSMLSRTVQMMTRKTVVSTIQQAVNKELRQRFGTSAIEALPPEERGEVVQVVDEMAETAPLQVVLLVDTSLSMKTKLRAVEEAIQDFMLSLQARKGVSEIAVFHFPSAADPQSAEMIAGWTNELEKLNRLFYKLNIKGATPTGPALLKVVDFMVNRRKHERTSLVDQDEQGILRDYVV
jgi:Ca-activated chloride channel family protein